MTSTFSLKHLCNIGFAKFKMVSNVFALFPQIIRNIHFVILVLLYLLMTRAIRDKTDKRISKLAFCGSCFIYGHIQQMFFLQAALGNCS